MMSGSALLGQRIASSSAIAYDVECVKDLLFGRAKPCKRAWCVQRCMHTVSF